jgi:hypothetical protein
MLRPDWRREAIDSMDDHLDQRQEGPRVRKLLGLAVVLIVLAAAAATLLRSGKTQVAALQAQSSPATIIPAKIEPSPPLNPPGQAASNDQKYRAAITIEDVEDALPPIVIGNRNFTVMVQKKRLLWPAAAQHKFSSDDDEIAVSFDVKDSSGVVALHRSVMADPREIQLDEVRREGRFLFSTGVDANQLVGSRGQALMVVWAEAISAPDACANYLILGLFDGKLKPYGEAFCEDLVEPASVVDRQWELKTDPETGFDIFEVRRRAGYYNVIIPVRIDFLMVKLFPAHWCVRLHSAPDMLERCEFAVEAERIPATEDTFVRLYPEADEQMIPKHVVVKPNSKVEFLSALAHKALDRNGKWIPAPNMEIPWLKVRIDGQVGWVHAEEDLIALGLSFAG